MRGSKSRLFTCVMGLNWYKRCTSGLKISDAQGLERQLAPLRTCSPQHSVTCACLLFRDTFDFEIYHTFVFFCFVSSLDECSVVAKRDLSACASPTSKATFCCGQALFFRLRNWPDVGDSKEAFEQLIMLQRHHEYYCRPGPRR